MLISPIESSSLSIAALVGTATALNQSAVVQEMGVIGAVFTSPMGSAVVAGLVAFGTIKTSVKIMERDLQEVRRDVKDVATRVARIEGKLEAE
jgi:phosphate/sulfate permease